MLITGGSGKLGRYFEGLKPTRDELDLLNFKQVREYLQKHKPEKILHLAKVPAEVSRIFYSMALDNGCKRFVFTSSCAVYNQKVLKPTKEDENIDPQSEYGENKLLTEQLLENTCETNLVVARIFNLYGPGFDDALINMLLRDKVYLINPSFFYRDHIFVEEVVRVLQKMLNYNQGIYNLGTGKSYNTSELVGIIRKYGIQPNTEIVDRTRKSYSWADISKLKQVYKVYISNRIKIAIPNS